MYQYDCSSILAKQPRPTGPNIVIITNAGGPGVLATDSIIEKGGKLAKLSDETVEKLNAVLPKHWSKANPVDIIPSSSSQDHNTFTVMYLMNSFYRYTIFKIGPP